MNALNGPMFQGLVDTLRDANRDSSIGVIVLSHTGPHFGVGGDLTGGGSSAIALARIRAARAASAPAISESARANITQGSSGSNLKSSSATPSNRLARATIACRAA